MTLREAFTSEYMESIKKITLQLKSDTINGGGRRKSRAKGQSVEFSDFRNYVIGDNAKNIDWKSYGRLDKLFIKLFMEERQANVNIILDCSGSMNFGDKSLHIKMLSACLSYLFMLNMDRVNLFAINNSNLLNLTSPNNINRVVDFLDRIEFSDNPSLIESIKKLDLKQGNCIFISDFLVDDDKTSLFKLLAYKKQKVNAVMLLDKTENNPEILGDVTLEDSENNSLMPLSLDNTTIKTYKKALDKLIAQTADSVKRVQGQFCFVTTDMDILRIIKEIT